MTRKKTITAKDERADVKITIEVSTGKTLTEDEGDAILTALTDRAMLSIKESPYMRTALHEIAVM